MAPASIEAAMKVLSEWNPLGAEAAHVVDLDGYRTEAIDILMQFTLEGRERSAPRIVQAVLSQAFDLDLTLAACQAPAVALWRIHHAGARPGA
jgi:hypothetical protein